MAAQLALLWQIEIVGCVDGRAAVRALGWRWTGEIVEDRLPDRGQARLRWRPQGSFFSAPLWRGDGIEGRRRRSLS
jgi:hypothetical protein